MNGIFWEGDFGASFIPIILQEVYIHGVYAPFLQGKRDLTIIDAGANVGIFSMYASPIAKRIIAVEPAKRHIKCIQHMTEVNGLENIEIYPFALSDQNNTAVFHDFPGNATMGTLTPAQGWNEGELVCTVTMKALFEDCELDAVDFMKLDIEGGEAALLRSPEFAEVAPKIACIVGEHHQWSDMGRYELVRRLTSLGYHVDWIGGVQATMFSAIRG